VLTFATPRGLVTVADDWAAMLYERAAARGRLAETAEAISRGLAGATVTVPESERAAFVDELGRWLAEIGPHRFSAELELVRAALRLDGSPGST
jgi:hypothetical protein